MPKLPSSADVQTINPGIARDPGLRVPAGAFESPLGVAATELSPAIGELAKRSIIHQEQLQVAADKQQSRDDTVESSALTRDLRGEIESLTVEFTSEKDLSLTPDAQEYGAALEGLIQNKLNSFTGSADARAKLEAKFNTMQGDAIGVASGIGVTVGNDKVLAEIETEGNTLVTSVSDNPSSQNILLRLSQTDDLVDGFAGAIGIDVELQEKSSLDDRIASKGINTQLNIGNIDKAELLLGNPTIFNSLSPASQKTLGNKIQVAQEAKRAKIKEVDVLKVIDTSGKLVDSMLDGGSDPKAIEAALTGLMNDANDPNVSIALQGMIDGLPESQEAFITQKTENEIAADQAIIDRLVEANVPEDTATLAVLGNAQINVDIGRDKLSPKELRELRGKLRESDTLLNRINKIKPMITNQTTGIRALISTNPIVAGAQEVPFVNDILNLFDSPLDRDSVKNAQLAQAKFQGLILDAAKFLKGNNQRLTNQQLERVEIALTLTKATTLPETAVETIENLFDEVERVAEDIRSDLREGRIDIDEGTNQIISGSPPDSITEDPDDHTKLIVVRAGKTTIIDKSLLEVDEE